MLRESNYAVFFEPILIPPSSLRLVFAFRELISSSLPHSDVGHPYFAAEVQRQYAEDAKVDFFCGTMWHLSMPWDDWNCSFDLRSIGCKSLLRSNVWSAAGLQEV
jgi:hypothetical protein